MSLAEISPRPPPPTTCRPSVSTPPSPVSRLSIVPLPAPGFMQVPPQPLAKIRVDPVRAMPLAQAGDLNAAVQP